MESATFSRSRRTQIFLDWPGDRVGAVGPRNAAKTRSASPGPQSTPARSPVYGAQDTEEGDEGWWGLNPGGLSGSRWHANQLFVSEHARKQ